MAEDPNPIHHILVATDGSEASVKAGRLAVRLAGCHNALLTFVYVVDESVAAGLADASGQDIRQVQGNLEQGGQRYLNYLTRLAAGVKLASAQTIRKGEPYEEITALAREQQVDLIVIGQVGRRGLRRILIGSVTERVIEHASCPVMVVK
jgi:nucleotide-binding universal stress UspA family protein